MGWNDARGCPTLTSKYSIRLMLIDDAALFRAALRVALNSLPGPTLRD